MSEKKYYIESNSNLQGYDILKRDGVVTPEGKLAPERIATVYSMDYMDSILEALNAEDSRSGDVHSPSYGTPIIEIDS